MNCRFACIRSQDVILIQKCNVDGAAIPTSTRFAILTFFPGWTTNSEQLKCKFVIFLLKSSIWNLHKITNIMW